MSTSGIFLLGLAFWALRLLGGLLIGQQVKGSIPDYTAARARAAARRLPHGLAERYEEEWLASLEALVDKPISALRYAHGLRRAASSISAERGLAREPGFRRHMARAADAALGLLVLLLLAPLVASLALAVGFAGGARILSREPAFGLRGRKIYLFSFRLRDRDDRGFTSVGRLLRRYDLAGLPLLLNVIRGEVAFIGPPILRPVGVKISPRRIPVPPGLLSWERMAKVGYLDIDIHQARGRDEQRTLRSDLALALHWPRFVASGAEFAYYEESHCDCGSTSGSAEGTQDPPTRSARA